METQTLDNDTRGWIMCIVSGIACVVGASIICVDLIVRLFPGKRNFRIEDSNVFLACSLSLSFGVMLFSALHSMLPEAKEYLKDDGWSDQSAGLVMMGCFIGGFFGIQAVSRLLHQFMPTHVVDCDHTHKEHTAQETSSCHHSRRQSSVSRARRRASRRASSRPSTAKSATHVENGHEELHTTESTPLLASELNGAPMPPKRQASMRGEEMAQRQPSPSAINRNRATTTPVRGVAERRASMLQMQKRVLSFVKDTKCNCDESGSCYGYTDPCGQECFKHVHRPSAQSPRHPAMLRTTTGPFYPQSGTVFNDANGHGHGHDHDHDSSEPPSPHFRTSRARSREPATFVEEEVHDSSCSSMEEGDDIEGQHHHHVPTNAFLSIGLQTSIAIALHKFPEGFITYATNHANPSLGFNVFMALFVHNITEGFAMALPLYMAIGSRWRAMAWSALLGGLSQPFGAAVAWLWFKLASRTHMTPNAVAYACLFALTSGIMVSVALQLFVESLSLNHNRNLCIFFGFLGMALLGLSNAVIAEH